MNVELAQALAWAIGEVINVEEAIAQIIDTAVVMSEQGRRSKK